VGDRGVKAWRRTKRIRVGPGGIAADYVPFYFAPRSPMLFKIWRHGVEQYPEGRQEPLIYLVTALDAVERLGLPFVFSDGNCAKDITDVFDDLSDLDKVDWLLMKQKMWNDTASDGDRMRRRMAEFLVYDRVPWSAFLGVGTMTGEVADRVRNILASFGLSGDVIVKRDWYY
jgi:ssDNA thymidine ADP-ribosyltransferase, DarT